MPLPLRRRFVLPLVFVPLLLTGCATPLEPAHGTADPPLFQPVELSPHVTVLTQGDVFHVQPRGNVEIIEQSDGVVLVDSGGSPAGADEVIAYVKARTRLPVKAVVLTHWHGDHTLGVSRLLEVWPQARIISTPATRDMLASPASDRFMPGDDPTANARYQQNIADGMAFLSGSAVKPDYDPAIRAGYATAAAEYERYGREMKPAHRVVPGETFIRKLSLPDPRTPVDILFLGRANTTGDAVVWLPGERIVITGDTVVRPVPYGFNSYPADWTTVLNEIHALNAIKVVPGHGAPMSSYAYVEQLIDMLADVRRQVAPLAKHKKIDSAAAMARVDMSVAEQSMTHGDPWLALWFARYWKEPIIASALKEARGEPIIQGGD
jgi:glyoxylase-like metal-dependent hydrolase (beta-lactamase superfamily II)